MKKILSAAALAAFAISGHAALQDRDLDHNGTTDAFYDTDLNITWLRDANYALTSGTDNDGALDGRMDWVHALAWADGVTIFGYSDWRLPTTNVICGGANCSSSEMGHLYYTELQHVHGSNDWGGFLNIQEYEVGSKLASYWSATPSGPNHAFGFSMGNGNQAVGISNPLWANRAHLNAMLVHDGDISPAPEPETYAMLLAGLGVMGAVARRRKTKQA